MAPAPLNPRRFRRRRRERFPYTAGFVSLGCLALIGYSNLEPASVYAQAVGAEGLAQSLESWVYGAQTPVPYVSESRRLSESPSPSTPPLSPPPSSPSPPGTPPSPPSLPSPPGSPPAPPRVPPSPPPSKPPPECGSQSKMERDGSLPEISFAEDSKAAATVFEIVVMLFMFLGLAIVCDEYFEAALEAICEAQGLQDDVAGATWMAAGGSAPELATSLVGTLISFSDVGFGTIVGSAVFNVLFVIACCAFVAPNLKLQWYPLARDATCYCFAILWLVIFTGDARVHWWEALLLFALYIGYVTIMKYNVQIETWVNYRIELTKQPRNRWQSFICWSIKQNWFHLLMYIAIFSNTIIIALDLARGSDEVKDGEDYFCFIRCVHDEKEDIFYLVANTCFSFFFIAEMLYKWAGFGFFGYWRDFWNYCDGVLVCLIIVEWITYSVASNAPGGIGAVRALRVTRFLRAARMIRVVRLYGIFSRRLKEATTQVVPADWKEGDAVPAKNEPAENGVREMPQINSYDSPKKPPKSSQVAPEKGAEKAYGDAKPDDKDAGDDDDGDDDDDGPSNPFEIPDSPVGKFFWALGLPLSLLFFVTIPDCRRPMFKRLYMLTFAMSIFWIGALAFVMVWMATEFGIQYELPASVMGITILAAGTSIPDCLSSIAVARRGHGDMAVSSSIGSNIFDILVGLPIPWFIYGAIFQPLSGKGPQDYVEIDSDGLTIMVLLLFIMVALVIAGVHFSGWKLTMGLGYGMMFLYGIFLAISLLLEYGVILCDD